MYDNFKSIADAKQKYRRCRNLQHFTLADEEAHKLECSVCHRPMNGPAGKETRIIEGYKGNRCVYYPKTKQVTVMHYLCAWNNLLQIIYRTSKVY